MPSTMVFAISTPSSSCFLLSSCSSISSTSVKTSSRCSISNSAISIPKSAIFQQIKTIPRLGFTHSSQWNGLKQMGMSYSVKIGKRRKCKGKGVYASLFGVGAPEVLVIGVVALLVFGPKGLAEVARNLGKTLRAFQPTIRELQEVSREFKSTLEREIGLDDIDNSVPKISSPNTTKPTSENTPDNSGTNIEPNGSSSENGEDSVDESLKLRADRFRGALAQLQKEQEEEREKERAQGDSESEIPSQDTQALDTPQEASSSVTVTPPSDPSSNALQEDASIVLPTVSAPMTETQI
ncbi:hypothetical protein OROGR_022606 [Orobanche gracilis]